MNTEVVYKGKVIGNVYTEEELSSMSWGFEHSSSGVGLDGYDTKGETIEELREYHLCYLTELKGRYREIKKEMDEWEDHLK